MESLVREATDLAQFKLDAVEKEFKEAIRNQQIARARDKTDFDLKIKNQYERLDNHGKKLKEHGVNFEAIAIVNSMLIENVNMQMEGEIADLLDRNLMSLFGVATDKVDKIDV